MDSFIQTNFIHKAYICLFTTVNTLCKYNIDNSVVTAWFVFSDSTVEYHSKDCFEQIL